MKSDTPITVAAIKRLAEWEIRADAAARRGSHLDSDDPEPPGGFEVAESIERAANDLAVLLIAADTGEHPDIDGVNWHDAKEAALKRLAELKK